MKKNNFKDLVESGVTDGLSIQEKRAVIFSNYVALVLISVNFFLFILIPQNINPSGFLEMLIGMSIFGVPILLNKLNYSRVSQLYLCGVPPAILMWFMIRGMQESSVVHVTSYDGLRFYLLAFSCIPYLLLSRKQPLILIAGILPGFLGIVFCDYILEIAGVGASQKGVALEGYAFTKVRAFISYVIINSSCFFLHVIIDRYDQLNQKLIQELEEKNQLILEQSAEKIQTSEHRYRSLFEQASDAILLTDLKGKILDCNLKMCELVKYEKAELLKRSITDLADKTQLHEHPLPFEQVAKGNHVFSERRFLTKDKQLIEIESSIQKISDTEVLAIIRDVSKRKKIENELREAELKFRTIVEKSLVGVYIMLDGKFAYVNPRFSEMLGYQQEELINTFDPEMVVHFEDRPLLKSNIQSRLAGNTDSIRYELRGVRKDKSIVWLEAFGSVIQHQGKSAIIGTLVEITERKKFEEQQTLLASVISSSEDGVITQTLDGIVTSWNAGAERIFGYSSTEMIGQSLIKIIPPEKFKEADTIMHRIEAGESVSHFETQRLRRDGSIISTSVSCSPLRNDKGSITGVAKIIRDITPQKKAEAEREQANYTLNERVKELTTLYKVSQFLQTLQRPLHETLQDVAITIPFGWQYPEVTVARIVLEGMEFSTGDLTTAVDKQKAPFVTQQGMHGCIEVGYTESKRQEAEGPFLTEERNLINMLAEMVQVFISARFEADALKRSEANQSSIINNTNFLIWSVNREYELMSFNKPFEQFTLQHFGIPVKIGTRLSDDVPHLQELRHRWTERYVRALAGEAFKVTGDLADLKLTIEYSLNPIIEDGSIVGVAVFGEDITERLKTEKAMAEANKQIGELRLMALRSAMNPHFIFNSLNSIQYYILENDQTNAVTYLSAFSKLIRAILNNSVHHRVRLSEELEMLGLYVKLESMRFENKFDYHLQVDDAVDIENIEIPSMLIQPYVENAILHGLYNKQGRGVLTVRIADEEDFLVLEIEDNGVGRQAAANFKLSHGTNHKSLGTALTEERLNLINKEGTTVEIIDLEENDQPCGTKVKIQIKI